MSFTAQLQDDGLYRVSVANRGQEVREDTRALLERVPLARVDYDPTDTRGSSADMTQCQLFRADRDREARIIAQSAALGYRSLCVYVKRDKAHKRLAAIVIFDARGTVWVDIVGTRMIPRGIIPYRSVSVDVMRDLLGEHEAHVYAQDCKEWIRAYNQRKRHDTTRTLKGLHSGAPRLRNSGRYSLKCHHVPDPKRERAFLERETQEPRPEARLADRYLLESMQG